MKHIGKIRKDGIAHLVAIALLMAFTATASAQTSAVCNDDGTVTFYYTNPGAKSVQVDVQFAGRKDMTRGVDGVWYHIRIML